MDEISRRVPGYLQAPYLIEMPHSGVSRLRAGEVIPRHRHQLTEVHYVSHGEVAVTIGRQRHHVAAGNAYILHAGDAHAQSAVCDSVLYFCSLTVSHWHLGGASSRSTSASNGLNAGLVLTRSPSRVVAADRVLVDAAQHASELMEHLQSLRVEQLAGALKSFLDALASLLTAQASGCIGDVPPNRGLMERATLERMGRVASYIETHHANCESMERIAHRFFLGRRQLSRLFREALGVSAQQYLMEQRLRHAMRLLQQSETKIDAVMVQSGFRSRHHFYKLFQQRTGLSPEQFRRSSRASIDAFATGMGLSR